MTVTIDPEGLLDSIYVKSPTETNELAVDQCLNGCSLDNIPMAFESLALSPLEADK